MNILPVDTSNNGLVINRIGNDIYAKVNRSQFQQRITSRCTQKGAYLIGLEEDGTPLCNTFTQNQLLTMGKRQDEVNINIENQIHGNISKLEIAFYSKISKIETDLNNKIIWNKLNFTNQDNFCFSMVFTETMTSHV